MMPRNPAYVRAGGELEPTLLARRSPVSSMRRADRLLAVGWLMAAMYDRVMRGSEEACLRAWRHELLRGAEGRVLEIGAGTGATLPSYTEAVTHLTATEPDPHMRSRLDARRDGPFALDAVDATADALPFEDAVFDTVVSSLVLCSVRSLEGSLAEVRRVLVPGGRLLFLEHVAATDRPDRLKWQRRMEPAWRRLAGNCHLTRGTEQAIRDAGFELDEVKRESIRKAMPLARPSIRGVARVPHED